MNEIPVLPIWAGGRQRGRGRRSCHSEPAVWRQSARNGTRTKRGAMPARIEPNWPRQMRASQFAETRIINFLLQLIRVWCGAYVRAGGGPIVGLR